MKNSFFILFICLLFACQNVEKADKPEKFIAEEKMIDILFDLSKIEAAASFSMIQYEKREIDAPQLILDKYQIDSTQLAENIAYYSEDYNTSERLYDSVRARLDAEKTRLDSLREKETRTEKDKRIEAVKDTIAENDSLLEQLNEIVQTKKDSASAEEAD